MKGGGEDLRRVVGGEALIRIYYMKEKSFSIEENRKNILEEKHS